eukprot:scaffold1259_cov368-Prasinococcus_capsulatus_cf.AAC.9
MPGPNRLQSLQPYGPDNREHTTGCCPLHTAVMHTLGILCFGLVATRVRQRNVPGRGRATLPELGGRVQGWPAPCVLASLSLLLGLVLLDLFQACEDSFTLPDDALQPLVAPTTQGCEEGALGCRRQPLLELHQANAMVMTKGEGRDGVVQVRIDGVHAEYRLVPRRVQVSLRLIPHGPGDRDPRLRATQSDGTQGIQRIPGRKVPIVDRVAWYHALLPVVALRTKVLPCILAENGQRSVVDGGWKGLLASSAQTSLDSQLCRSRQCTQVSERPAPAASKCWSDP